MTPLASRIAELVYPLTDFYSSEGRDLPDIEPLAGPEMPEPYRSLLVHQDDMTPTLEAYCGRRIHLRRLAWKEAPDALYRQVVLETDDGAPMEFGAIKIHLDQYPPEPRKLILEGYVPLGTILADYDIRHTSRPNGFFSYESDALIMDAFGLDEPARVFGRHNILRDAQERPLAEVVEVLPPFAGNPD